MKKVMIIFGTRPEAIKLAPVIKQLKKERSIKTLVCSTGQHREMLEQVLKIFRIKIDYDLALMKHNQDLYDITLNSLSKLKSVFEKHKPDLLIVQGDTTTAFVSALAAYYAKIKVAHVEAGLRSYNIFSPYPEEANRRFISVITQLNFAPTSDAKDNLNSEGFDKKGIFVTGNTVVDAILEVKNKLNSMRASDKIVRGINKLSDRNLFDKKFILVTLHRREKFGPEFSNVCETIRNLADKYPQYNFIYPVHLNPNVRKPVKEILNNKANIILLQPLDYLNFIYIMSKCHFILSDSGGVQEECFVFKKPILVMRDVTERNEAIRAGYAFLVGSNSRLIQRKFKEIDSKLMKGFNFFKTKNPFGDGKASAKIVKIIKQDFKK